MISGSLRKPIVLPPASSFLANTEEDRFMFIKAPFLISHDFLREFCYPGPRRFIALYWTPLGDEACFDDGQSTACGLSDNFLFLTFLRRKDVWAWRDENE